jgi:DNA (cytosine-5)-methyltransferase 1
MGSFTFIDLFAGIGGFHAALSAYGGQCVWGIEIDPDAARVYEKNWGLNVLGDITVSVSDSVMKVPKHDVLCAGFPCQPFSKSGAQRGMEETRGTLFWSILKIIQAHAPALVILENVRNLAGPRHKHEWQIIIQTLRNEGYRVSDDAAVFSPHLLPRRLGGRPQVRERVFIVAVRDNSLSPEEDQNEPPVVTNRPIFDWDPTQWNLENDLPLDEIVDEETCALSDLEQYWIDAWDDFVVGMWELREGRRLPGFPIWGDDWVHVDKLEIPEGTPAWKADFLRKNSNFYTEHQEFIDNWIEKWDFFSNKFPASRRKLEWQAQDTPRLWDTVMHFRPSGIRAKKANYLPALVAITQTSIIGPRRRRLSPKEAARLQGFPDWFDFGSQKPAATYKQLGNGVSVGAVWHVVSEAVSEYENILKLTCPSLVESVKTAPENPDEALNQIHLSPPNQK